LISRKPPPIVLNDKNLVICYTSSLFGPILSTDSQCSSFEPIHSAIIKSRQTKWPSWRML